MEVRHVMTGDGCRIAWRADGPESAPLLVLSNSLGIDMGMWAPQMAGWARHFRVVRYDQRGHGRSDVPPGAYGLDRLGRDVIELLDALGIEAAHFCGLSLGGMVGQWLGIHAGHRLRRLILADTSSHMGPPSAWNERIDLVRAEGMAPLAQASVERWFTADFAARAPEAVAPIREMLLRTDPTGYAGCCAAIRDMDLRRTARLIEVPALVIGGAQDSATPPPHSEALARTIPGALLAMLDAAHLANVERAAEFEALVADFLGA